jgi:predicted nucleotidyltransferase
MPEVDERAVVPAVDDAARQRLAAALDWPPVISALLFGSQATGKASSLSDIDIAVCLAPECDRADRQRAQLELMTAAAAALGTGEVQIVVLNDATPLLRHRAMRDGLRLLDRDPRTRVQLETKALLEYLDTAPLRAAFASGLRHRIDEGRFGRP